MALENKEVRQSVAALLDVMLPMIIDTNLLNTRDKVLSITEAMNMCLRDRGLTFADVGKWVRGTDVDFHADILKKAREQFERDMAEKKEQDTVHISITTPSNDEVLRLCKDVMYSPHYAANEKEQKFLQSVLDWVTTTGRSPSPKQMRWLKDLHQRAIPF